MAAKMRDLKIAERMTSRTKIVERYLSEVSKEKMFDANKEYVIACKAASGDQAAIESLVRANLRFVVSVAKQYASNGVMLEELIAQGNLGLIDAAKTFDPTRGFKFISYAVWHIRKEILKYLNDLNRTVRIPLNITLDMTRGKKAERHLIHELGREASPEELAEAMTNMGFKTTPERVIQFKAVTERSISLEPTNPDEEFAPIQWLTSDDEATSSVEASERIAAVKLLLGILSPVEEDVVKRRLGMMDGHPEAFSTIGIYHERTGEWARGVFTKSIKKIKVKAMKYNLQEQIR